MKTLQRLLALFALLVLAACGGGGGSSGAAPFGAAAVAAAASGGTGGGTTTPTAAPTVTLSISSATVTSAAPATVTAVLRDGTGTPISGKVLTVATARTGLAVLSAQSILTDSNGSATVIVSAASGALTGADEVAATTSVGSATVNGSVGFNVSGGAAATMAVVISTTTLRASAGPATLSATLRDAANQPVANQRVSFAAASSRVTFGALSALTNGLGVATTSVSPSDSSTSAAESINVSTTVNGRDLESTVNVQVIGESPSMSLTLSSSTISSTAPATVLAVVRDSAGGPVADAIVSFTTQYSLGIFDAATARTDATGTASVVLSPRTVTTSGADAVNASVTVLGITKTAQAVAQFTSNSQTGTPVLLLSLSTTSVSAASPASVVATLQDARGQPVPGQVVTFSIVRGLARTNVNTALTDAAGVAVVVMSPAAANSAGADEISVSASYAGSALQATQGFQVQATSVALDTFTVAANPLSAYGQTTLTLALRGASVTSPVSIGVSSACVSLGKATLSPASFTATSDTVTMQYRDNGCGALQTSDQLQAVVTATGASLPATINLSAPAEASLAFVQAAPEQIFLRGAGFTESSVVTFEVRDAAGNPLPNRDVELRLQTGAGGVTMEGRGVESVNPASANPFKLTSNALGRVAVRVNSGTLPTPVRVNARLASNTTIATVSSNLSVAVGLPSQLNFSLSQGIRNIEGYNIDGASNTYQIIAADRSGNPVPAGTSINFVAEGGQIEAIKQTQIVNGISRTTANFVSAEPRPVDGRVTISAYALGEESFLDLNGNNVRDAGEPFQDLGNIFKDRNFDGTFDAAVDEFVPLAVNNTSACAAPGSNLLLLDPSIPSVPGTCDGVWSGAGQVYVRRAAETVLSTSTARPLWYSTRGLTNACTKITLQTGPTPAQTTQFTLVAGDTWYGGTSDTLSFIVADANPGSVALGLPPRLNPMAFNSSISASTPTSGLTVTLGGGSPVGSTTEASVASIAYSFTDPLVNDGIIFVRFTSPSNVNTSVGVAVKRNAVQPSNCP